MTCLRQAVQGISDIITIPGIVNRDFADVRTIMQGQGYAVMGTAVASGANRAVEAATRAIASPLLEDNSIQGAQSVPDQHLWFLQPPRSSEVHEASSVIEKAAHENAKIIFVDELDENMKEQVKITVIAAGFREAAHADSLTRNHFFPAEDLESRPPRKNRSAAEPQERPQEAPRPIVNEVIHQENTAVADDLDVPTFLRRAAQKA